MMRIGIFGYGNLGRGAAAAAMAAADMELCGIFTRRDPAALGGVPAGVPVYAADSAAPAITMPAAIPAINDTVFIKKPHSFRAYSSHKGARQLC